MKPEPTIRQANPSDLEEIKQIIDASFPIFFRFFALHSAKDPEGEMLVSEADGKVVGFAKLIEFRVADAKYGCIVWIAVHPAYRRLGNALGLTNAGVDVLKSHGAKAVFASTQRRNKAAQATLRKAGFQRVGFLGLRRLFGWRVLSFYTAIWYAPGEIVYMRREKGWLGEPDLDL